MSSRPSPPRAVAAGVRVSEVAVLAASAWFLLALLWIVASRVGYPYALEWMEGGTLGHVARVLAGRPIYGPPSLEFTPYMYTPLFNWIAAPVVGWLGVGLPSVRVVSILAAFGLFVVVHRLIRRTTSDAFAAWCGLGVLAASFVVGGGWLDLARIDSMFLFFLSAALLLLVTGERQDLLAGVLLALAFLTKQTAVMVAAPLCAARVVTLSGHRRWHCGLAFAAVVGASTLWLDRATSGWYLYYVFELPQGHRFVRSMFVDFWTQDLRLLAPSGLAALYVLARRQDWRPRVTRLAAAVGLLGAAWLSRINTGGAANCLWPALILFAWLSGEAVALGRAQLPPESARRLAVCGLCLLQLGLLLYDPRLQIPRPEERRANDELVELLRGYPGPVLVPHHSELPLLAGKPGHAHEMAIWDVLNVGGRRGRDLLAAEIRAALGAGRFDAIVTDGPWLRREPKPLYERRPLRRANGERYPQTLLGWRTGPTLLLERARASGSTAP